MMLFWYFQIKVLTSFKNFSSSFRVKKRHVCLKWINMVTNIYIYTMPQKILPIRIQENCCILNVITPNVSNMHCMYVALIVLATVFSEAWYQWTVFLIDCRSCASFTLVKTCQKPVFCHSYSCCWSNDQAVVCRGSLLSLKREESYLQVKRCF